MEAADTGAIEGLFSRRHRHPRTDGTRTDGTRTDGTRTDGTRTDGTRTDRPTLLSGDTIAEGGSCTVRRQQNTDNCVKVVRAGHDCSAICEVAMLTALSHPNVMAVLGVEYGQDYMCIQMPYYAACLRDYCRCDGESLPMTQSLLVAFAGDIACGLAHIHSRGIIHADLKPDNILIRSRESQAVIADFGTSLLASSPRIGCDLQTPLYRAPENTIGSMPSTAMDMWSFGVILLEMRGFRHNLQRGKTLGDYRADICAAAAVSPCPVARSCIADASVRITSRAACGILRVAPPEGGAPIGDGEMAIRTSLPPGVLCQFAGRLGQYVSAAAMCVTGRVHEMTPKNAADAMRLSAAASGVLLRPRNGRR